MKPEKKRLKKKHKEKQRTNGAWHPKDAQMPLKGGVRGGLFWACSGDVLVGKPQTGVVRRKIQKKSAGRIVKKGRQKTREKEKPKRVGELRWPT